MLNISSKSNQFERDAKRNRTGYKSKHDELLLLKRPTILSKSRADVDKPILKTPTHANKDENLKPVSKSESYTNGFNKHNHSRHETDLPKLVLKPANQQQAPKPIIIQMPVTSSPKDPVSIYNTSIKQRLSIPCMKSPCKLLDENLQLIDTLDQYLSDMNENYTVIGVLGKCGVGKSTVMSLLSGLDTNTFKSSVSESETAKHKTNGIECYVTSERTILLDVQPLLSASVLDKNINLSEQSKKTLDLKYHENNVHMQSIELACFCLSVCNVVILMEDWFFDPNLITLIHTAEMLLPNMTEYDQAYKHETHLIYCLNKCNSLSPIDLKMMKSVYENFMKDSKLIVKGSLHSDINSLSNPCFLKTKRTQKDSSNDVNFVVLPFNDCQETCKYFSRFFFQFFFCYS